jgi:addiction module RelE/StbE family toxin
MYEIVWRPSALNDVEAIFRYIVNNLEAPHAAVNLKNEIDSAVSRLREFPFAHAVYRAKHPLKKEYRKITVKNYYIFYVVEGAGVEIHRVIYVRRNIDAVLA